MLLKNKTHNNVRFQMHSVLYKTQIYNYLTAKNICSKASLKKQMTNPSKCTK